MPDPNMKTVLIVEDTLDIANVVRIALEDLGIETYHMSTADKAVIFLESHRPDLIVLDIGLPGMSGWELLEVINERREQDRIAVIVTTAFTDPANRVIGKLQHVDHYFFKPFNVVELRNAVARLLDL